MRQYAIDSKDDSFEKVRKMLVLTYICVKSSVSICKTHSVTMVTVHLITKRKRTSHIWVTEVIPMPDFWSEGQQRLWRDNYIDYKS